MSSPTKSTSFEYGCVHGRFQPPHNGHLEYINAAFELCKFLWIGIARYDIRDNQRCDIAKHRSDKTNNPLTYFERTSITTEMLQDSGIDKNRFGFIPFPIDQPERLPDFLPNHIPCFTTVYDEWNRHKITVLKEAGYRVIVLWEKKEKEVSGQVIRDSIRLGGTLWEAMVPEATKRAVLKLDLQKRLKHLSSL